MINLVRENIITDLRKNGILINKETFNYLNTYTDIQNSSVEHIYPNSYRDIHDKNVLIVDDGNIIAVYGNNKFMYNPNKIKISNITDYDVFEVISMGVNVQNRRQQRQDRLSGLVSPRDFQKAPSSTNLVWSKDWDPEVNKVYYSKLLQRNHLGRYAKELESAYDVVKELIDQRKLRLTGKRSEYDRIITGISKQISKIEDEMVAAERDFNFDVTKLKKELSKLPGLIKVARDFIDTEEQEFATTRRFNGTGLRNAIPYDTIHK